jgi:hypothetical protein
MQVVGTMVRPPLRLSLDKFAFSCWNVVAGRQKVDDNRPSECDERPNLAWLSTPMLGGENNRMTAGYSGTPLAKKLGIKPGTVLLPVHAPTNYLALINPLPENVTVRRIVIEDLDLIHLFTKTRAELIELLDLYKSKIKQSGAIWVSWPKKTSRIPSEITEDTVREIALPLGLVDIKVCAVDDTWSGLKLVIRKENRK